MRNDRSARFDLIQTRIVVFDPALNRIYFTGIDRGRALGRRCKIARLCFGRAADGMFPVMPVPIQRVIHCFRFNDADAAATKRIVKHAIDLLPRPRLLVVSDIVENRSGAIFSIKRPADERPKGARDRRTVNFRSGGRDPNDTVRIGVTHFGEQRHVQSIAVPARVDRTAEMTPTLRTPRPFRFFRAVMPGASRKRCGDDQDDDCLFHNVD